MPVKTGTHFVRAKHKKQEARKSSKMALSRARPEDIPTDAVLLNEDQALIYQWKIISDWEKPTEVWALRFGPGVIAGMATATGIYVNSHYRSKLRLGNFGRVSTYLPIVVMPAVFSYFTHKFFVQRSLLLDPIGKCPTCLQMRAAAFQTGFGVVYPTILAPIAACMFATRHFTYRLPAITENPYEVLQLIRKFTKPIIPTLTTLLLGQGLLTVYITYKQQQQNLELLLKMKNLEEKIENEVNL